MPSNRRAAGVRRVLSSTAWFSSREEELDVMDDVFLLRVVSLTKGDLFARERERVCKRGVAPLPSLKNSDSVVVRVFIVRTCTSLHSLGFYRHSLCNGIYKMQMLELSL